MADEYVSGNSEDHSSSSCLFKKSLHLAVDVALMPTKEQTAEAHSLQVRAATIVERFIYDVHHRISDEFHARVPCDILLLELLSLRSDTSLGRHSGIFYHLHEVW